LGSNDPAQTQSFEVQRRAFVRELRQIGFRVLDHRGRNTLMEYSNPRDGYFYQVVILRKKDGIQLTGFAFMKPSYRWSYRIADHQAANQLKRIMHFANMATNGQRLLDFYLW
jgi:hypothetical protein